MASDQPNQSSRRSGGPPDPAKSGYRPDIDGLRAVAVAAVILFHVDGTLLPGGFAGVDIFYVISGFLITGILAQDHERGALSIREFYRRRMKRILPALAIVVLATLAAGMFILLPEDLIALSQSAVASFLFVANIYFDKTLDTSYFAPDSDLVPLLHIWSLGVEEQFYLVWPLALVAMLRFSRGHGMLLSAIILIAIASFVFGQILLGIDPSRAFYRMPARAGELMLGAGAYFLLRRGSSIRLSPAFGNVAALAAFGVIAWSLVFLTAAGGFPGVNAIPITLATAFLIWLGARQEHWVAVALSFRPVVWIGLVSYSLYLWHWPVLAYVRYAFGEVTPTAAALSVVVIVLLSALTYRLIEQPARAVRWNFGRVAAAFLVLPLVAAFVFSAWMRGSDGYGVHDAELFGERLADIRDQTLNVSNFGYVCIAWRITPDHLANPDCVLGGRDMDEEPRVLLWGDSNAAHYVGVIGALAESAGVPIRNIAHHACPPLLAMPDGYGFPGHRRDCRASLRLLRPALRSYDAILLAGQWDSYARDPAFYDRLTGTIAELVAQGHQVVVLGQVPRMQGYDANCEAKSVKLPFLDCRTRSDYTLTSDLPFNARLRAFADATPSVSYADVTNIICPEGRCSPYSDNVPLFSDPGHLSMAGSWLVGRRFAADPEAVRPLLLAIGTDADP